MKNIGGARLKPEASELRGGQVLWHYRFMDLPRAEIDPDGLQEFSVVFTDRSLNHMSKKFVGVMQEFLAILREAYNADHAALVSGGGSYAMESVARQLATGENVLVVRNGLFSYRWSQIFSAADVAANVEICSARPVEVGPQSAWEPAPIEEVVATIQASKPAVVFAPHVETAAGIILPDDYLRAVADAVHSVGGLFVLDCVASGALWVDMKEIGVDVLLTAPQKGWSGSPAAGYVILNDAAKEIVNSRTSTSFSLDLKKWLSIADEYREGRALYHATMPTDTIAHNLVLMKETVVAGWENLRERQLELGARIREALAERGLPSVAAPDYAAATVVVVHTTDPDIRSGERFKSAGMQVAAGVPLHCGERKDFSTVRFGLFGLDKLADVDGTVARFTAGLDEIGLTA